MWLLHPPLSHHPRTLPSINCTKNEWRIRQNRHRTRESFSSLPIDLLLYFLQRFRWDNILLISRSISVECKSLENLRILFVVNLSSGDLFASAWWLHMGIRRSRLCNEGIYSPVIIFLLLSDSDNFPWLMRGIAAGHHHSCMCSVVEEERRQPHRNIISAAENEEPVTHFVSLNPSAQQPTTTTIEKDRLHAHEPKRIIASQIGIHQAKIRARNSSHR